MLPGEKLEEKKQYAFDLLKELPELVSFTNLSINGTTYIGASFLSPVSAEAACKLAVSQDNPAKFEPVPEIRNRKAAPDSLFLVKIRDIPLDIDKPIFSAFLKQYGEIDSLKFHLQDLYYVAHVTYKTPAAKEKLGDAWHITYQKNSFRFTHRDLSIEEIALRNKYTLKLTNLLKNTWPLDLSAILDRTKAKSCFIPKKPYSETYQRSRFAIVNFATQQDLDKAKQEAYPFNNHVLIWTDPSTRLCLECGSSYHFYSQCKEYNGQISRQDKNTRIKMIQQRFGAIPKPKIQPSQSTHNVGQSNFYRSPNSQFVQPGFSYAKVASYEIPFPNYPTQNNQQCFILNKGKKIPQGSQNPKLNSDGSMRKEGHNPSLSTQQSQTASQSPQINNSSNKQNVFEQRIAKLEQSAQQYIAQVSSLSIQITNLQQQFIAYQQETNSKLDQIYAAICKEDSDDSPSFRKCSKSRRSSRSSAYNPINPSMHRDSSVPSTPTQFNFDPNTSDITPEQTARFERLENTILASSQQVASMSSTISNLVSPIRQHTSPASFTFALPVTPQTWTQLAQEAQNDEKESSEFEMDLNDNNSNKSL